MRPFVLGNKTDRRDCEAILGARHREAIVPVPVKTVEQQTICALHRIRAAMMKTRTARASLFATAMAARFRPRLFPLELSFGVSPSELAKRRPDLKRGKFPTMAESAVAFRRPTPEALRL